jgi:hypothetical protein
MAEFEKAKAKSRWRRLLEGMREKALVPLLAANLVLLIVLLVAAVILYLRLQFLEDRIAYRVEPALHEATDAMLQLRLTTKSMLREPPERATPPVVGGRSSRRPPTPAATGTPPSPTPRAAPETPPSPARTRTQKPRRPAAKAATSPDDAVRELLGLLSEGPLDAADKAKLRRAYNGVVSQGEAVVYPLLTYLGGISSAPESASYVFQAIEELATPEHKDLILQLFETHDDLAGALAALRLPEAPSLILAKLREERTSYSARLLKAAKGLRIEEAYPLIANYAAASGNLDAVGIMCSFSENDYDAIDDLIRILESRDGWGDSPEATMSARKAARALVRRGKKAGLDYMVSELEARGEDGLDAASMRTLRRAVDFNGTMKEFSVWLTLNAAAMEWSESKKRFHVP